MTPAYSQEEAYFYLFLGLGCWFGLLALMAWAADQLEKRYPK